jgi:hypothetical protein
LGIVIEIIIRAIYNVADYNFSRYLLHDFEIQEKRLLDGSIALTVSGFSNRVEVMDYFYGLRENPHFFGFERVTDNIVCLSESNNNKFYLSGLVKDYIEFFDKYYLQHADKKELEKVTIKKEPTEEVTKETETVVPAVKPAENEPAKERTVEATPTENNIIAEKPVQQATEKTTKLADAKTQETVEKEVAVVAPPAKEVIPETPVTPEAEKQKEEIAQFEPTVESIYKQTPDEKHHVLVIVRKTRIDYNKLQKNFTSHTRNNFGTDKKVQLINLGASHRMIQIDGFANADEAKVYIKSMEKYPYLTRDIVRKEHFIWPVSDSNLKKLNETIDIEAYDAFFKANY